MKKVNHVQIILLCKFQNMFVSEDQWHEILLDFFTFRYVRFNLFDLSLSIFFVSASNLTYYNKSCKIAEMN